MLESVDFYKAGTRVAAVVLFLGVGACSAEHSAETDETHHPVRAPSSQSNANNGNAGISSEQNAQGDKVLVGKFDDLKGNSSIIKVYPGPTYTEADQASNGTFKDGDTLVADCVSHGRTVNSVPPEVDRQSSLWVRLAETGQFATLVYTNFDPKTVASQLPDCD